jgi:hypothetical protein
MRFGLTVHPGFKSPSLRPTCTLSGDLLTGEGVFDLVVSFLVSFGPPERRADERARVPDLWRGDVRVPLRGGDARVAQDLLDDADVYALLDEERGRRMSGVMEAPVSDAALVEDGLPLSPVLGTADRPAVLLAEDQVVVLPVVEARSCMARAKAALDRAAW